MRRALGLVVLLLAGCGGTAPAAAPASTAPVKLAVSFPDGGAHLPLWYAQEKGIFQKNGLDVDLRFVEANNSIAALIAQEVDIATVGGDLVASSVASVAFS